MTSVNIHPELRRCVLLFCATLLCVFYVYGTQWEGGDPFNDSTTALESAKFSITLMGILLAHELGHYFVAKRHGFELSLPVFIPVPFAFGTLGAVIQLKSLPKSRSGLLEMGAAGPLAGFLLSILAFCIGLPFTEDLGTVQIPISQLTAAAEVEPDFLDKIYEVAPWVFWPLVQLGDFLAWLGMESEGEGVPLMILADPPLLKGLGWMILGEAPSRYATLDPIAFAGWVGCLLTAMNLLPIGQLDGGHIVNACLPKHAKTISFFGIGILVIGVFVWAGWLVWAIALVLMRAYVSLPIPSYTPLSRRAITTMLLTIVAFGCCFMPRPVMVENMRFEDIIWLDDFGEQTQLPEEFIR